MFADISASLSGSGFVLWGMRWHRVPGSAHLYVCVPVVSEGPGIQAHFSVFFFFVSSVFSVSYLRDLSLRSSIRGHYYYHAVHPCALLFPPLC